MTIFVFDIDGTICNNTYGEYNKAEPFKERIKIINDLYHSGHIIKYFTARGSGTGIDWREITKNQLKNWEAKYHELILGKPEGDHYIDDKGQNADIWNWSELNTTNKDIISGNSFIYKSIQERKTNLNRCLTNLQSNHTFNNLCQSAKKTLENKGKIIFAGNGGSFADSQHLSAEFISKLKTDRRPLPSIALGTNSSSVTAIGNDYGYQYIFSRELEAIGNSRDLLIAISTSGNSENILNLLEKAKSMSIEFFILTGLSGGKCAFYENCIRIQSENTALIQEMHIVAGHIICSVAEKSFIENQ